MTNEARARAALKALIKDHGGCTALARAMGDVSRQQIEQWDLIPLKYLRTTKARFGLGLKELRPDVLDYL
jgi:hypothetical protein